MQASPATRRRTGWNYFPHAMIAGLGFVVVVNIGMVWSAMHTFPGVAALDVFDHSNAYDAVLRQAAAEAALGWSVQSVEGALRLAQRDGRPLSGATVLAQARRPLGPDMLTELAFAETAPGRYVPAASLPAPGQWELRISVVQSGQTLHATRRIVAK